MASPHPGKTGIDWAVGRKIFGFTIGGIRSGPFHSEYGLSQPGRQDKLVVRVPHPALFKTPKEQQSFAEKIHQWVRLGMHPHLEACFGLAPGDASAYFLEDSNGATLTNWLRSGQCTLRTILSLLMQICHGLEYLHNHGIFHQGLSSDRVIITPGSLAKIKEIVRPGPAGEQSRPGSAQCDIRGLGDLLRMILFLDFVPVQTDTPTHVSARDLPGHLQSHAKFLVPVLEKCAAPPGRGYPDVSSLRDDLNRVYRQAYGLDCPYESLATDLRAESFNNQAVVCFATGRFREGLVKLQQALALHDRLSEAVYNLILYKLRSGLFSPARILLMIDAAMVDSGVAGYLTALKAQVSKMKGKQQQKMIALPSFLLCSAPNSLSLYRQARKKIKKHQEIEKHLEQLRYEACLKSLLSSWRQTRFEKDTFFSAIHDRLFGKSDKGEIAGVQRYATLQSLGRPVQHLAYLPGTRKIVEAGGDDQIRIRNYGPGSKVTTSNTGGQAVASLAVSPDGRIIAAGTAEGAIVFWQGRAGHAQLWRATTHHGPVNAMDFSRDGRFFASGGADGTMVVRTMATGREKMVTAWDDRQIACLSFVANGLDLVTGSDAGEIKIWAARGKKCLQRITAHAAPVSSLSVAPKGDFFASAGGEEIKLWDIHTGQCLQQMPPHRGGRTLVLLLDDNRHLVCAGMDDVIRIRDLITGEEVAMLDGRGNGIGCLVKGSHPHFFFAGQQGGTLLIWKIIYHLLFT
jgi:hypothetical protein